MKVGIYMFLFAAVAFSFFLFGMNYYKNQLDTPDTVNHIDIKKVKSKGKSKIDLDNTIESEVSSEPTKKKRKLKSLKIFNWRKRRKNK